MYIGFGEVISIGFLKGGHMSRLALGWSYLLALGGHMSIGFREVMYIGFREVMYIGFRLVTCSILRNFNPGPYGTGSQDFLGRDQP